MKKVFLVEDTEEVARAMQDMLERLLDISTVIRARSVGEGLTILSERRDFDLAVLDYELPDGFGTELMETLRRTMPRCKTVVCSGYIGTDPEAARQIRRQMPDDTLVLGKPFLMRDLKQMLQKLGLLGLEH